ncbi:PleD family two-component system response regulator [Pseudomonas aeruginosa]|uniref:response regulator n=1 Tax=Pseudomonas aeruginosa TaxID=287 RepID=UPI001CCFCCEB|nr:response regulator [Pseudomonas aeruginosa]
MSNLSPLRVMLVDDSRTIRKTGEVMLAKAGCEVLCVVDGFECLGRALDFKPDLIFIDVLMPRLNGYQTCQLIRSRDSFKSVPVVRGCAEFCVTGVRVTAAAGGLRS